MPSKPIPLGNDQQSAFDELSGASPSSVNVVTDARGTVRRRPGIAAYSEAPAAALEAGPIQGVYVTAGGALYAVGNTVAARAPVYRVRGGASVTLGGGAAPHAVRGGRRPVFAETEMLLVVASGGGNLQRVTLADDTSEPLGGTGQPTASHVIANASRLLANQLDTYRSRVHWSDIATGGITYAGHEVWAYGMGTAGFFTQEARPDPVVALGENTNEVWVWGSQTLQIYAPDPTAVYAPVAVLEHGCAAPYSIIKVDGSFAWLDDRRRIVMSSGRSLEVLSEAIQEQLAVADHTGCYGFRVITGRCDALCWVFPATGQTFVWQKGAAWCQWQGRAYGNWAPWGVTAHHLRRDTNVNVVGTSAGKVARLDDTAGDDLGTAILASVTTGFIDRGIDNRKHCEGIRVVMRRDRHLGSDGQLLVSWRDGPGEAWEPPLEVELGSESDPVVEFNSLGVYRHRQWRFQFSGSGVFTLIGVTERYEVEDA